MSKTIPGIKTSRLRRRLSLSLAGFKSSSRYALGGAGNLLKSGESRRAANDALLTREARSFVDELGKLKGAYVKIGQMLGIYGQYVLPAPLADALLSLNDRTPPLAWSAIEPCLREDLGDDFEDFDIDTTAVAAASIGQVHRAVHIPSGRQLCLKVQYPEVARVIDNDFKDVIGFLEVTRWLRGDSDSKGLVSEVHELLKLEVDYHREAQMCRRVGELLQGDDRYLVPAVYDEFSGPKLLVMDFLEGHNFKSADVAQLPQSHRNALAEAVLELFFKEVFQWRLLQTDANLGNYLVDLTGDSPRLGLVDFGAVREMDGELAEALCHTIAGAVERDTDATIAGLDAIGCFSPRQSEASKIRFAEFCFLLVEPFRPTDEETPDFAVNDQDQYCWHKANLVRRTARLAASSALVRDFSVPPREFGLLSRKLSGVYAAMAVLQAELDASGLLQRYIREWRENRPQ